jgi:hypothetical protein
MKEKRNKPVYRSEKVKICATETRSISMQIKKFYRRINNQKRNPEIKKGEKLTCNPVATTSGPYSPRFVIHPNFTIPVITTDCQKAKKITNLMQRNFPMGSKGYNLVFRVV